MLYFILIIISEYFFFSDKFIWLREEWLDNEYYSFAPVYIVFLILLFLIKLHKSRKEPVFYQNISVSNSYSLAGLLSIFLSIIILIFANNNNFNYLFHIGMLALCVAFSIIFIQKIYLSLIVPLFIMLIPVIPLPHLSEAVNIIYQFSGELLSNFFRNFIAGISVENSIFIFKTGKIEFAELFSGINGIVVFPAALILIQYALKLKIYKRIIIVIFSIFIPLFSNFVRLFIIILYAHYKSVFDAVNFWNRYSDYFLYGLNIIMMIIIIELFKEKK